MATGDRLSSGVAFTPGGVLVSSFGGQYVFTNQFDGNLVIYQTGNPTATWTSGTQGKGCGNMVLEMDGNVVLYSGDKPIWATFSQGVGTPPYNLVMRDDGNLVLSDNYFKTTSISSGGLVTNVNGKSVMESVTWLQPGERLISNNTKFSFVNQLDGNLYVYRQDGKQIWSSETYGNGQGNVFVQMDGNVVFYNKSSGKPVWASQTSGVGRAPFRLAMQDDGNLVLYDDTGNTTWATNTDEY